MAQKPAIEMAQRLPCPTRWKPFTGTPGGSKAGFTALNTQKMEEHEAEMKVIKNTYCLSPADDLKGALTTGNKVRKCDPAIFKSH